MQIEQIGQKNLYHMQVSLNGNLLTIVKSYDTPIIFINWTTSEFYLSEYAKSYSMTTTRHTNYFLNDRFRYYKDKFETKDHFEFMELINKGGVKL